MVAFYSLRWLNYEVMEVSQIKEDHFENHDLVREEVIEPMPIARIAKHVGKSHDWVKARIGKFSDEIIIVLDSNGHSRTNYSHTAIEALRAEADAINNYPIVEDTDISINGLSLALQREERWVSARLAMLDIVPTEKRNPANNRIFGYYDEEKDLALLRIEDERVRSYPVASQEYSTVEGLARQLGHDRRWVRRRLRYVATMPTVMTNPDNGRLDLYFLTEQTMTQIEDLPNHHEHLVHRETNVVHPAAEVAIPSKPTSQPYGVFNDEPARSPVYEPEAITPSNWMQFSECVEVDPEIFTDTGSTRNERLAKEFCGKCAVRLFCLDYAIASGEDTGIWGGLDSKERKALSLKL